MCITIAIICVFVGIVLLHIRILFTQQSSDTTQFMCSMDTVTSDISHVDNATLSTPKPFQFTASAELHSLPTVTSETSTNTMPIQDLSTKTLLNEDDDEFSTPDNQSGVPLIQPLSHSPHVPGKTPSATSTMIKSKLFASTTASSTVASTTASSSVTTDSPSHYASVTEENNTLPQNTDFNSFATSDDNLNVADKSTDSTTGQQDVEYSMEHTSELISSDSKDDVKEKNVDISDTTYVQLDAASLTKGSSYSMYVCY